MKRNRNHKTRKSLRKNSKVRLLFQTRSFWGYFLSFWPRGPKLPKIGKFSGNSGLTGQISRILPPPYIDHILIQGCVVIPPRMGGFKSILSYDEKTRNDPKFSSISGVRLKFGNLTPPSGPPNRGLGAQNAHFGGLDPQIWAWAPKTPKIGTFALKTRKSPYFQGIDPFGTPNLG